VARSPDCAQTQDNTLLAGDECGRSRSRWGAGAAVASPSWQGFGGAIPLKPSATCVSQAPT